MGSQKVSSEIRLQTDYKNLLWAFKKNFSPLCVLESLNLLLNNNNKVLKTYKHLVTIL